MKSVTDAAVRAEIGERLGRLADMQPPLWGRMTCPQMVCHIADQIRIATGDLKTADGSSFLSRTLLKRLVLLGMPAPRGRVKTVPEIDQAAGNGTRPGDFAADRNGVLTLTGAFAAMPDAMVAVHPVFGAMTKAEWGRLIFAHLDHHLKQFGA